MEPVRKYDFRGKVALVTGSSSGIGEACAVQLAQYGAKVTITGRNVEALGKVAAQIEKVSGEKPLQVVGDLAKDSDLPKKLIEETVNKFGRLDVLVNNAGGGVPRDSFFNPELLTAYDSLFQLNVRSVLNLTRLAVPHLEKTKGNIVNISSVASLRPLAPLYSMSKAAVDMLTKTAAQELGSKGIRVNSVNPGPVRTNIHKSLSEQMKTEEEKKQLASMLKAWDSIDIWGEPVDIANLVSFLASSDAANITGSIMVSDKGSMVSKSH